MEPSEPPIVLFSKRSSKLKSNLRKRPTTPPPTHSNSDSEEYSSDDGSGRRIKRRRRNAGIITASSATVKTSSDALGATQFEADRSKTIESTNDATKQSNWFDEGSKDDIGSKNLLITTRGSSGPATEAEMDDIYKGTANYKSFIPKNPNAPSRQVGPVKAPTNIRTITVTDFAPDVCKDYKQTGFCGFGDSCKFLHAREDYKQGWELDRDWEIGTKGKKVVGTTVASANRPGVGGGNNDVDDELLENIPFACIICRRPYINPILTKCGHYFCEACALNRYRRNPSCAACGAGTGGVFNSARNLQKLLEKKKDRARKRKEEEKALGQETSDVGSSEGELDA
ncbi:RNA-splicing factor [Glutinoglossum americanum]|uniref:Pre-mRNA-splicing factor CWC24 n=1 Tax=Glutinoglossum americanum TaxID=1670608 RepID=A0A9P8HTX3_9PEZI|nr:RNA-splicing factor [Glutinoglossum americanum]